VTSCKLDNDARQQQRIRYSPPSSTHRPASAVAPAIRSVQVASRLQHAHRWTTAREWAVASAYLQTGHHRARDR